MMAPKNCVVAIKKNWDNFKAFFAQELHKVYVIPRTEQAEGYSHIYAATGQENAAVQ